MMFEGVFMDSRHKCICPTSSKNSLLPVFEAVAQNYGGEFKNFKFDFSNSPEGFDWLRKDLCNPVWLVSLLAK